MRRSPVTVELPAYVALSWDDDLAEYLLLPDLATYPLRALHRTLGALISLNQSVGTGMPTLMIATTDDRLSAWHRSLHDLARSRRAAPLAARVVTGERWATEPSRWMTVPQGSSRQRRLACNG
jgi:hypothetical protein